MIKNPTARRQPVGYLQSAVEMNPGQPETNRDQRLERDLNIKPTPQLLQHASLPDFQTKSTVSTSEKILNNINAVV